MTGVRPAGTDGAAYKNLVAAVLGLNGAILVAVGVLIAISARARLAGLGLDASQIQEIAPTFYGLGFADATSSLFSALAAVLVYRERPLGRVLALVVGATQLLIGMGLYLVAGVPVALYFIALRGAVVAGLAWRLPARPV